MRVPQGPGGLLRQETGPFKKFEEILGIGGYPLIYWRVRLVAAVR
jgi:hypothetical protein